MPESGILVALQVDYVRIARYSVRYQLKDLPTHQVMIAPNPRSGLVGEVRASQEGDSVTVTLSEDGSHMLDWENHTEAALWKEFPGTWGEMDD
ncbi:hypothetical protein [Cupriavidus sp. DL-D2]|jgi:hypothetical protein|uniref:hypothetical protein n=1 Tax=Cupriavidus sp. DL-D2 TaxID=3144974 RepID=UPI0032139B7A